MAVYICKEPGGKPSRYEADTSAAAAWAHLSQLRPRQGRVGLIVWQDTPRSPTIAMSIDPLDDTPMGGRTAIHLGTAA